MTSSLVTNLTLSARNSQMPKRVLMHWMERQPFSRLALISWSHTLAPLQRFVLLSTQLPWPFWFDKLYASLWDTPAQHAPWPTQCIYPCFVSTATQTKAKPLNLQVHYILFPSPDQWGNSIAIDFVSPCLEEDGHNAIVTITDRLGLEYVSHLLTQTFPLNASPHNSLICGTAKMAPIEHCQRPWQDSSWASSGRHSITYRHLLKMSSLYHPETDSSSEHSNKTIVQTLRYHVECNQKGWAK